jgi:hypothetical protein
LAKEEINMRELVQVTRPRKPSQSWASAEDIWSTEYEINGREFLRAELRQGKKRGAVVDVRRWRKQPDGTTRPTEKGFAISVRHLSAIIDLLGAALAQAAATPAITNNERPQAATPTRSASGAACFRRDHAALLAQSILDLIHATPIEEQSEFLENLLRDEIFNIERRIAGEREIY